MIARVALLSILASRLNLTLLVEQPGSSLMARHPRWLQMIDKALVKLYMLRFYMGAFGSGSLKPTIVYSNSKQLLQELERAAQTFKVKSYKPTVRTTRVDHGIMGTKKVTGLSTLKSTQSCAQSQLQLPVSASDNCQDLSCRVWWCPGSPTSGCVEHPCCFQRHPPRSV
jgi:hypothetical protein